jgi:hypothetical protein
LLLLCCAIMLMGFVGKQVSKQHEMKKKEKIWANYLNFRSLWTNCMRDIREVSWRAKEKTNRWVEAMW